MLAHILVLYAAIGRAVTTLFRIRLTHVVAGASVLVAGCTQTPLSPLAGKDASDPGARVSRVGYRATLGSYTSRRPVEPAPWRDQNERVAPAIKP